MNKKLLIGLGAASICGGFTFGAGLIVAGAAMHVIDKYVPSDLSVGTTVCPRCHGSGYYQAKKISVKMGKTIQENEIIEEIEERICCKLS